MKDGSIKVAEEVNLNIDSWTVSSSTHVKLFFRNHLRFINFSNGSFRYYSEQYNIKKMTAFGR